MYQLNNPFIHFMALSKQHAATSKQTRWQETINTKDWNNAVEIKRTIYKAKETCEQWISFQKAMLAQHM